MTIEELRDLALSRTWICLVLARPCTGRRGMMIAPGLIGEVLCENADGHAVVGVDSETVLRWLKRNEGKR